MPTAIVDQVVDFYSELFNQVFAKPFQSHIAERLRRNAVDRQVAEAADAASQSLIRFLQNEELAEEQVTALLGGFNTLARRITIADIANPNVLPETLVEELLLKVPCPHIARQAGHEAIYRLALFSTVQVLMLVGPVMAEWQNVNFASTFELPRRVVSRLNQISEQLNTLTGSRTILDTTDADERFELSYRDYLLQRFNRVEAGTVRMTTSQAVDLGELFVMPRISPRTVRKGTASSESSEEEASLMNLAAARRFYGGGGEKFLASPGSLTSSPVQKQKSVAALTQVQKRARNVFVGTPGSGKSTFLEWLQLKIAGGQEVLILGNKQAIPLLLRVRQLDPQDLPQGAALIAKATDSLDRASIMPAQWIERQMKAGRVLVMIDGLDETEPELLEHRILPWLEELCKQYQHCRFLVSSRPVGYSPGLLRSLKFAECDLLDFTEEDISQYTQHWCTAVRLARNEPETEARREGENDGREIVQGFQGHAYISNLARNPLMLSAICLVNYFEDGDLPKDRSMLYKLCVEGLLHHWDQRRGIHSDFTLSEKLRACRAVALAMQADDRAEYEAENVQAVFSQVFGNTARARQLLEHIRYRTGLLIERRSGIFAFAHLTFQEYLAACAVHEGNNLKIDAMLLANEHADGRWNEVIALYCGLTPAPAARQMIDLLIAQPDTETLSHVLTEAYRSVCPELSQDHKLCIKALERIALTPVSRSLIHLSSFPNEQVEPIANSAIGRIVSTIGISQAYFWLLEHKDFLNVANIEERLKSWRTLTAGQISELLVLFTQFAADEDLGQLASDSELFTSPGPRFGTGLGYDLQANVAIIGLGMRKKSTGRTPGMDAILLCSLTLLSSLGESLDHGSTARSLQQIIERKFTPCDVSSWAFFISAMRKLVDGLASSKKDPSEQHLRGSLQQWADQLEQRMVSQKTSTVDMNVLGGTKKSKTKGTL